jgi:uncharacterized membrane protein YeaQ/YmgE (transglycosylase-associated protein family)
LLIKFTTCAILIPVFANLFEWEFPARCWAGCFPLAKHLPDRGAKRRQVHPAMDRHANCTLVDSNVLRRITMGLGHLLMLLLVAGICGALGQAIAGYSRGGCLTSIALGFVGALLGAWLARLMGLPELLAVSMGDEARFPIVWSIIGAALFVALLHFLAGPWRNRNV